MSEATCKTCRWFDTATVGRFHDTRVCRRYPEPVEKAADSWCGEHSIGPLSVQFTFNSPEHSTVAKIARDEIATARRQP